MKKVKIIAVAIVATCAFGYAMANTNPARATSHQTVYALRDTVPVTNSKKSHTTSPTTPTTMPSPTTTPAPAPSPTTTPATTPVRPTPTPTSTPTPVPPTTPPAK